MTKPKTRVVHLEPKKEEKAEFTMDELCDKVSRLQKRTSIIYNESMMMKDRLAVLEHRKQAKAGIKSTLRQVYENLWGKIK